ncbi:hypothetical protein GCM10010448_61570 [Streptomyces glomeratus]|uniref:Uncharacterized protein n=1 Tax=Streptomyces glomeratus TaxID=284452 RepID=A0ABP6M0K5_9ACTN
MSVPEGASGTPRGCAAEKVREVLHKEIVPAERRHGSIGPFGGLNGPSGVLTRAFPGSGAGVVRMSRQDRAGDR